MSMIASWSVKKKGSRFGPLRCEWTKKAKDTPAYRDHVLDMYLIAPIWLSNILAALVCKKQQRIFFN